MVAWVCCMHRCTGVGSSIVFHRTGGLAKMAVSAERSGVARRGEPSLENSKNRGRSRPAKCFGAATINDRRAKIVLCFHLGQAARSFLSDLRADRRRNTPAHSSPRCERINCDWFVRLVDSLDGRRRSSRRCLHFLRNAYRVFFSDWTTNLRRTNISTMWLVSDAANVVRGED